MTIYVDISVLLSEILFFFEIKMRGFKYNLNGVFLNFYIIIFFYFILIAIVFRDIYIFTE